MTKISSELPTGALVVGTVHSPGSLQQALRLRLGQVDLLEIRVDHFADDPRTLLRTLPRLAFPLLITGRHPSEGGANDLNVARRRALMMEFLPFAQWIDVELRSVKQFGSILDMARERGIKVVISNHHFHSTPSGARLDALARQAKQAGADIFKLATFTKDLTDIATLSLFLARRHGLPLSVMGMGPFGKVSRLLFAQGGSVLNYGYLDQPNATGQWEATLLKQRLCDV